MNAVPALQPNVDPRIRMKEIRSLVKDHVTGKNKANVDYLGQLKLAPEDMTRMVIALQDMLTKEREKHKRCRDHLLDSQDEVRELAQVVGTLAIDSIQMQGLLTRADGLIEGAQKQIRHSADHANSMEAERNAVLTTIKLLQGNQGPSVSVAMGYSNKERG
jgi:predicted  nucleic acid-binding Zn-ribbon protein